MTRSALDRRGNARGGKANVSRAEVVLAAPEQSDTALFRRHPRRGEQAYDGGLVVVIGGTHTHHLGQPPHVVVDAPGGEGGVKGRSRRAGPADPGRKVGEQRQPVRHARERALRLEVVDASPGEADAWLVRGGPAAENQPPFTVVGEVIPVA